MNSTSRHALALLALLLALPAQAQEPKPKPKPAPQPAPQPAPEPAPQPAPDGEPGRQTPPAKPLAPATQSRVETALDAVRQKVLAGEADRSAYEDLVAAIRGSYGPLEQSTPNAVTVRARLVEAVDDIYARAKRAKIAPEEFAALRVELLDADVECALAALATAPDAKSLESFGAAYKPLADAAQELDPTAAEARTRMQALLDGLKKKPALEAADVEPLHEELAHARALRSESLLEKRATAKGATPTDFARARNHVSDLLELQARRDPDVSGLQKKLVAAIDELERRAAEGMLTRADFESLRKEITQRGRTALTEKGKPHG